MCVCMRVYVGVGVFGVVENVGMRSEVDGRLVWSTAFWILKDGYEMHSNCGNSEKIVPYENYDELRLFWNAH